MKCSIFLLACIAGVCLSLPHDITGKKESSEELGQSTTTTAIPNAAEKSSESNESIEKVQELKNNVSTQSPSTASSTLAPVKESFSPKGKKVTKDEKIVTSTTEMTTTEIKHLKTTTKPKNLNETSSSEESGEEEKQNQTKTIKVASIHVVPEDVKQANLVSENTKISQAVKQQKLICPSSKQQPLQDDNGTYISCQNEACPANAWCWFKTSDTNAAYCCQVPKLPEPLGAIVTSNCSLPDAYMDCWSTAFNDSVHVGYGGQITLGNINIDSVLNNSSDLSIVDSWQSACEKYPVFTQCLESKHIEINDCPMTQMIHNLMTNIFSVCEAKNFDANMKSLDCDLPEIESCLKSIDEATSAVISSGYYDYRIFCGEVGSAMQCVYPAMQKTCKDSAEASYNFLLPYVSNILGSIFGETCKKDMLEAKYEVVHDSVAQTTLPKTSWKWTTGAAADAPTVFASNVPLSQQLSFTKDGLLLKAF